MSQDEVPSPSHYDVQKQRRAEFITEWRRHRQTIVTAADGIPVEPSAPTPGQRSMAYLGEAAGRPTRLLDATRHDFAAGTATGVSAQSWDAVCFVVAGSGTLVVDSGRHDFRTWDAFHLPAFRLHQCEFTQPTQILAFSSFPAVKLFGAARLWSGWRDENPVSDAPPASFVPKPLARSVQAEVREAMHARLHTDYDQQQLRLNPKGTRSKFLVDPSLGYRTSGLTMVMTQYAPGRGQAMHAHPGEAYLYVVEGEGETYVGDEPEGGEWHRWTAGDFVVVDHFVWHQHRNLSADSPARLLRVHMMETMLATMQALVDPIELLLEPDEIFRRTPDASGVAWPEDRRPAT